MNARLGRRARREKARQLLADLRTVAAAAPRLYATAIVYRVGLRNAVAIEDAEARVRAVTGCTPEQARAHA